MLTRGLLLVLTSLALSACDPIGDCLDNGGVWVSERKECFCSRNRIGTYEASPSEEQLEHRQFCDGLTNKRSVLEALDETDQ